MSTRDDLIFDMVQRFQRGESLFGEQPKQKQEPKTPPPATMTQTGTPLAWALDKVQRLLYGVNAATLTLVEGTGEAIKSRDPMKALTNVASLPARVPLALEAAKMGITGKLPVEGKQVMEELGVPSSKIIPTLLGPIAKRVPAVKTVSDWIGSKPILGATWSGTAGMIWDIKADPLAPVKLFGLTKAGKGAQIAGTLERTLGKQAAQGQRTLLAYDGKSLVPRVVDEAAFKALDATYQFIRDTPGLSQLLEYIANVRISAKAKIEYILQERRKLANYLSWRSKKFNTKLDDEIKALADSSNIPEEVLREAILEEAQNIDVTRPRQVDLPERAGEISAYLREMNDLMGRAEVAAGIPTKLADESQAKYLHAEITDEFRKYLEKNKPKEPWYAKFLEYYPAASLRHSAQKPRKIMPGVSLVQANKAALEGRTAWQVGEWVEYTVKKGDSLSKIAKEFKTSVDELAKHNNIADPNKIRAGQKIEVPEWIIVETDTPQAKPALPKMQIYKTDLADFEASREAMYIRTMETARALDEIVDMGLTEGWATRSNPPNGWQEVSAPRFGTKLKGIYFRPDAAKALNKFYLEYTGPADQMDSAQKVLSIVLSAGRSLRNAWRNTTLFPFPEYHVRNAITGIIKNWLELDIALRPDTYAQGHTFALARAGNKKALEQLKVTTKHGRTYTGEELIDLYQRYNIGHGWFRSFGTDDVVVPKTNWLNPLSAGQRVGEHTEDILRGTAFMELLKRGHDPKQAAKMVKAVQFDYTDVPGWVRVLRDTIFPFITWQYKNIPREAWNLATQPGKVSQIVSMVRAAETGQEGFENVRPEDVAAAQPWNVLPIYIGNDEQGKPQFISASAWALSDLGQITSDPVGTVADLVAPWAKAPAELPFNYDWFTGKPIEAPEKVQAGIPDRDLYAGVVPMPKRLIHTLEYWRPTATLHRIGRALTKPGADAGVEVRKFLFGYKPYSVDELDLRAREQSTFQDALGRLNWEEHRYGLEGDWARQRMVQQDRERLIQKLIGR